jgi:hypothetical protein
MKGGSPWLVIIFNMKVVVITIAIVVIYATNIGIGAMHMLSAFVTKARNIVIVQFGKNTHKSNKITFLYGKGDFIVILLIINLIIKSYFNSCSNNIIE